MYAKVFRQIYESSIAEDPDLRFTFMDMLVLANMDGVVDMTHESIARITNRPIEAIRKHITTLEGPDPRSRTADFGGARIKRLDDHRDWGWVIVNYERFRLIASEEQRRAKNRERVSKFRKKSSATKQMAQTPPSLRPEPPTVTHCNAPVTPDNACNAMQRQKQKQMEESVLARASHACLTLQAIYGRTSALCISEREQVAGLARRPDFSSELDEITAYHSTCETQFFPNLSSLLARWEDTLDRARNVKKSKPHGNNSTNSRPNPRNAGIDIDTREQGRTIAETIARRAAQRKAELGGEVAPD
jgi:hypothetical protein